MQRDDENYDREVKRSAYKFDHILRYTFKTFISPFSAYFFHLLN